MRKSLVEKWNEYLFQDGMEYSKEEVIEKLVMMYRFMKSRKMRFDISMLTNPRKALQMYILSNEERKKSIKFFKDKQYDNKSCNKIVDCMDAVYQMLDITFDDALDFADYTSKNGLTLTKGIKDKFDVDLDEINLFLDEVMVKNQKFCLKQAIKHGKELYEDLMKLILE